MSCGLACGRESYPDGTRAETKAARQGLAPRRGSPRTPDIRGDQAEVPRGRAELRDLSREGRCLDVQSRSRRPGATAKQAQGRRDPTRRCTPDRRERAEPLPCTIRAAVWRRRRSLGRLACVESDVDVQRREVRARGTKNHNRDRIVRVAQWAWPFVEKHLETLTPGERLFRGIDRWQAGDAHRARLTVLSLPHHRVHDSRHFYAIRAIRAGTPWWPRSTAGSPRDPTSATGERRSRRHRTRIRPRWVHRWVHRPGCLTMRKRASRWVRTLWRIAGEGLEPSTPAL